MDASSVYHNNNDNCFSSFTSPRTLCLLVCVNLYADDLLFLTRVVNTSLDDVIQGEAAGGGLASQLAIDLLGQHLQQMTASAGW